MCDNFYNNCPPKMNYFDRMIGSYEPNTALNQKIAYSNGISRDDDYRTFLQMNGAELADQEWAYLRQNNSCFPNECVFTNKRSLVHPSYFEGEMKRNNELLTAPHEPYICKPYADNRMASNAKPLF